MRAKRYLTSKDLPMSEVFPSRGDGTCVRCRKPLVGRQTRWCSAVCTREAFDEVMCLRGSSTHLRAALHKRDNEICRGCGVDTKVLARILTYAVRSFDRDVSPSLHYGLSTSADAIYKITGYHLFRNLWEADHIIEVAAGGSHELTNMQTLCVVCHKAKTKRFAQGK